MYLSKKINQYSNKEKSTDWEKITAIQKQKQNISIIKHYCCSCSFFSSKKYWIEQKLLHW